MAKIKRPRQHFPLVEVWWDDATGCAQGWIDDRDLKIEPTIVLTVGFLIKDTEEYIIIASDIDNQKMHNGRTQIPKGMVKVMKVLKKADEAS